MKKLIIAATIMGTSALANAGAAGGDNCGWGNMILEGKSGLPVHLLATSINGTSGNATFGMTSGTNGCSTDGSLTYGGKSLLSMNGFLNEVSEDIAMGEGEALSALIVSMGVQQQDRQHFKTVAHQNFDKIFTHQDITVEEFSSNLNSVMEADTRLSQYAS